MLEVFAGSHKKKFTDKLNGLQPYVLTDYSKIITKKSVNRFFGQPGKSDWINEFMHGFSRYGLVATGLLESLSNPVLFKIFNKEGYQTIDEGYSLKTLLESCEFILFAKAEGFLSVIELKYADIAN